MCRSAPSPRPRSSRLGLGLGFGFGVRVRVRVRLRIRVRVRRSILVYALGPDARQVHDVTARIKQLSVIEVDTSLMGGSGGAATPRTAAKSALQVRVRVRVAHPKPNPNPNLIRVANLTLTCSG